MMRRSIVKILFIGLLCCSTINAAFAVVCHGADGHITLEPVKHSHCECSDDILPATALALNSPAEHNHCVDSPVSSNIVVSPEKNVRFSVTKVLSLKPVLISDFIPTQTVMADAFSHSLESAFHAPLRTIVLLV